MAGQLGVGCVVGLAQLDDLGVRGRRRDGGGRESRAERARAVRALNEGITDIQHRRAAVVVVLRRSA